jgi:L-threonylcarbamoyladenylate synthase
METVIGKDLIASAKLLRAGELVAIPTETVYGLAGNALDETAVLRIFSVKDRPAFDPLIVHVGEMEDVYHYVSDIPLKAQELMEAYWPGPLTIVMNKKSSIPDVVTSGLNTVGIRMPADHLTLELLQHLNFPLAAPSANPFGYISPTSAAHVNDQLGGKIPYILDGGSCSVGVESTIVGFEEGECVVYRIGGLTLEQIRKVTGPVRMAVNSSSDPKAPGMLKSHYAPLKPFYFSSDLGFINTFPGKKVAVIGLASSSNELAAGHQYFSLSPAGDYAEATRNLFALLRQLDKSDFDLIIAQPVPEVGLGRAINDRLKRAAAK